jgi:hypothetical protein
MVGCALISLGGSPFPYDPVLDAGFQGQAIRALPKRQELGEHRDCQWVGDVVHLSMALQPRHHHAMSYFSWWHRV